MNLNRRLRQMARSQGFSLIELMMAVAIVGILAGLVVPGYLDFVRKGRRADAHTALMDNLNRMEQFFLDHKRYPDNWTELGYAATTLYQGDKNKLWADPRPERQYYTLQAYTDANVAQATQKLAQFGQPVELCTNRPCFIVVATAMNGQQKDVNCTQLAITSAGAKASLPKSEGCW